MMDNDSLVAESTVSINTYEDIDRLLFDVFKGEQTDDALSWNDIVNGRTYLFYGTKVFEFVPQKSAKSKGCLKVAPEVLSYMSITAKSFQRLTISTQDELDSFVNALTRRKCYLFRHLITRSFGCCNDFMRCSDLGECIHPDKAFYNGCIYRTNLEQGKIFYGPKRNID